MFKNVASQKLAVYAFDATTGVPKTGDAANLTAYVSKDFGSVTVLGDTSATEMDATNAKGMYLFDLTQGETNADCAIFTGKSSTANIYIAPQTIYTDPANYTTFSIDSSGNAKADVAKLLGTAWLTPGTAGTPDVNVKLWNALATVALPLIPTVAGRTLDCSAGGEAGVDWANVGSPTTTLALTGTTIAVTQKVDVDTIKTNPVVNGGTTTFPTNATLASTTNLTAGTIATVSGNVNGNVAGSVGSVTGAVGSVTGAVGSVTGNVGGNVVGTVASVVGAVGSVTGLTASDVGAIKVQTDKMAFTVANVIDANVIRTNGDATAAANVAKLQLAIGVGTVTSGASTTSIPTSAFTPTGIVADQFKGRIITFRADTTTTALRGQSTDITASSAAAAPTFTVTALTSTPSSGDTFIVT